MKNRFAYRLFVTILIFFSLEIECQNLINGPNALHTTQPPQTYNLIYFPSGSVTVISITWSSNNSNIQLINNGGYSCSVKPLQSSTSCKFILTAAVTLSSGNTDNIQLQIRVEPFIPPTCFYVGEANTFILKDNCENTVNHFPVFWQFSCTTSNVLSCAGNCNSTIINQAILTVPNPPNQTSYNVTGQVNCGLGGSYSSLSTTIPVCLRNPVISGPISVGCSSPSTLVYTASQVLGANHYVWTLPNGWSGNSNTNQITVTTSGNGAGNLTLQAFASNNSPIKSSTVTLNVGCCVENKLLFPGSTYIPGPFSNILTGTHEADNSVKISNLTNVNAICHAGNYVRLTDFISDITSISITDNYFHAYIEGCSGSFYRTMNQQIDSSNKDTADIFTTDSINNFTIKNKSYSFNVFPNPNNGNFVITLDNKAELPISITMEDVLGKRIFELMNPKEYLYNIHLNDILNGVYLIKLTFKDRIEYRKFIKK